jgi:hypothetical protein
LDSDGNPHIVYADNTIGRIRYARWNGVFWSVETIDSVRGVDRYEWIGGSSLALDSNGNPHVSYMNMSSNIEYEIEKSALVHAFLELNPTQSSPAPTSTATSNLSPAPSPIMEPTSTPKPPSGFLGTNLPAEYGYALVAVLVIIVVAGLSLVYLKKLRKPLFS